MLIKLYRNAFLFFGIFAYISAGRGVLARRAAPAYTRSVHVHRVTEPSSPASSAPRLHSVHTFQQPIRWRVYSSMSRPRERSSAPRLKVCLTFFRGAGNLLFISGTDTQQSLRKGYGRRRQQVSSAALLRIHSIVCGWYSLVILKLDGFC